MTDDRGHPHWATDHINEASIVDGSKTGTVIDNFVVMKCRNFFVEIGIAWVLGDTLDVI